MECILSAHSIVWEGANDRVTVDLIEGESEETIVGSGELEEAFSDGIIDGNSIASSGVIVC